MFTSIINYYVAVFTVQFCVRFIERKHVPKSELNASLRAPLPVSAPGSELNGSLFPCITFGPLNLAANVRRGAGGASACRPVQE